MSIELTDQVLKTHAKDILNELRAWNNHEHQLIANRVGWLLTSTAFLLGAITLIKKSPLPQEVAIAVSILGTFISFLVFLLVCFAAKTIGVMQKREDFIYELTRESWLQLNHPDNYCKVKYSSTSTDQSIEKSLANRSPKIHKYSIRIIVLIPGIITSSWLLILVLLAYLLD